MSRTRSSASSRLVGLVDLEVVLERLADPEPDERVTVDHKAVWALAQDCFRSLVCGLGRRLPRSDPVGPILAQAGRVR